MTIVSLTVGQAQSIASFANVLGDKNSNMYLQHARFTVKDNVAHIVGTNQYVMAQSSFNVEADGDVRVLLNPDILKALKAVKKYVTELEVLDDGTIIVRNNGVETRTNISPIFDNYPKVDQYLADIDNVLEREGGPIPIDRLTLNLDMLAKVAKLVSPNDYKTDTNGYEFYATGAGSSHKPSPIVLRRSDLGVLVQPMISR